MAAPEPDWLRLQKKIFQRYVAQKLKAAGNNTPVNNLLEELKSTNLLIDFAEALSGKAFAGKKPSPSAQKIQQMNNATIALKFVKESCGVSTQTSAENIVDGNEKLILGMIFQIILKFMKIEDEDGNVGSDVKEALMLWLKNRTAGYNNCNITDFTKSFHSGLPFCALIHKMRPKLINYDSLNPGSKLDNIALALDLGEKFMNVPRYIEPSDIAHMDEVGMIVYLSDWYYGVALLQKQDVAARRIGKLIVMTELHDNLKAQYNGGAAKLKAWVDAKIAELNGPARQFNNTLKGVQDKLAHFADYKKGDKANKIGELLDLESLFQNIAARLHHNNRPAFNPANGLTPAALRTQFDALEKAELEVAAAYATELSRQLRLHKLAASFKATAQKLSAYVGERDAYFKQSESIDSVESAEAALEQCQIEHNDLENARGTRLKDLEKTVAELEGEKFEGLGEVKSVHSALVAKFDGAASAHKSKHATLQSQHKQQLDINDGLCKALAAAVNDFTSWLNKKKQALEGDKGAALDKQLADVKAQEADSADSHLAAVKGAEDKVVARNIIANPYTNVSYSDCTASWAQFGLTLKKKKELLESQIEDSKKAGLTSEQLQEIKDNFNYFDRNKTNDIDRRELRACLQSLGVDATPKDVDAVFTQYASGGTKLTFEQFKAFMIAKLGDSNSKDEILQSFRLIALEKDTVRSDQLTVLINDMSWKQKHVDYLNKEMKPKADGLDYPTWTDEVFAR